MSYIEETLDRGWIAPDGYFYGCGFGKHTYLLVELGVREGADHIYKDPEDWIGIWPVSDNGRPGGAWFHAGDPAAITEAQLRTLEALGCNVHDKSAPRRDTGQKFKDFYPHGYRDHPLAQNFLREIQQQRELMGDALDARYDHLDIG